VSEGSPRIAVFGLGEAGSLIAADIVAGGAIVAGYDPADVATPAGVDRRNDPSAAVEEADFVLAITAAADATTALGQAIDAIAPGAIYADLATASPDEKRRLARTAAARDIVFADVALMAIVPGKGISTPSIVSGPGAFGYAELITRLGGLATPIGDEPGMAATRKLLRSIVMKGLAALTIEAMAAAREAGEAPWLWEHLTDQIAAADEALLERLVIGTGTHAERRQREMEAARALLEELGVEPVMTAGTVSSLEHIRESGLPSFEAPT
jgi:3-hydroxyisobutyrate dehydrogenase-like beta-hydroxyacid dehydrogenase